MVDRRQCVGLLLTAPLLRSATHSFEGVDHVVGIGDIHGDYETFSNLLHTAGLVDGNMSWAGGTTHLVMPGDFLDRGNASRKVMDLLISLEPQAEKSGGRVHALLGNHEAMNLYGDLRYAVKADFEAFQTPDSQKLLDEAFKSALRDERSAGNRVDEAAFRRKFEADHPLGWVERKIAFSARGKYGKWLRQKDAIVKVNDMVFLHGGISPKYASASISSINSRVHAELDDFDRLKDGIVTDEQGPLWYRGLAEAPDNDAAIAKAIGAFLERQDARHIVIGHTPQLAILPRFLGRVICIDVGLSRFFGGDPAFLLVEQSKFYAVHRGHKLDLPMEGQGVPQYLAAAADFDPPDSALRRSIGRAARRP